MSDTEEVQTKKLRGKGRRENNTQVRMRYCPACRAETFYLPKETPPSHCRNCKTEL